MQAIRLGMSVRATTQRQSAPKPSVSVVPADGDCCLPAHVEGRTAVKGMVSYLFMLKKQLLKFKICWCGEVDRVQLHRIISLLLTNPPMKMNVLMVTGCLNLKMRNGGLKAILWHTNFFHHQRRLYNFFTSSSFLFLSSHTIPKPRYKLCCYLPRLLDGMVKRMVSVIRKMTYAYSVV